MQGSPQWLPLRGCGGGEGGSATGHSVLEAKGVAQHSWVQFLVPGLGGKKLLLELVRYLPRTQRRERHFQPLGATAAEVDEVLSDSHITTLGGLKHLHRVTVPTLDGDLEQWC